jgi:hypothetical protein
MEGGGGGVAMVLTEGFNDGLGGGERLMATRSNRRQSSLGAWCLEHTEAILGAARGVAVSYGARDAFYRPGQFTEGSGGTRPAVEFNL